MHNFLHYFLFNILLKTPTIPMTESSCFFLGFFYFMDRFSGLTQFHQVSDKIMQQEILYMISPLSIQFHENYRY